jgi:hypothetical protein
MFSSLIGYLLPLCDALVRLSSVKTKVMLRIDICSIRDSEGGTFSSLNGIELYPELA